jgi:hypothetical protein
MMNRKGGKGNKEKITRGTRTSKKETSFIREEARSARYAFNRGQGGRIEATKTIRTDGSCERQKININGKRKRQTRQGFFYKPPVPACMDPA